MAKVEITSELLSSVTSAQYTLKPEGSSASKKTSAQDGASGTSAG